MTQTKWTEERAWNYLAGRWDKAQRDHLFHEYAAEVRGLPAYGLCGSIEALHSGGAIEGETYMDLDDRLYHNRPKGSGVNFWWPNNGRGARSRAAFCRKMARLAQKEGRHGRD